jgi:hypothetical protein
MSNKKSLAMVLGLALLALAAYAELKVPSTSVPLPNSTEEAGDRDMYIGLVRIYMLEPISRYTGCGGEPYKNGFLSFALDSDVVITDNGEVSFTTTWDSDEAGWTNIDPENLMAIAALTNSSFYGTGYSEPPDGHPFSIYPVDAAASATLAEQRYNVVSECFTHTVFVEEATEAGGG